MPFGAGELGKLIHDIGKYSDAFQRVSKAAGGQTTQPREPMSVSGSTIQAGKVKPRERASDSLRIAGKHVKKKNIFPIWMTRGQRCDIID